MKNLKLNHVTYAMILMGGFLLYSNCKNSNHTQSIANTNSAIQMTDYRVDLENTAGYDEFEMHCITCHSLRYIEMQPAFPKKTWETIVHKMVKNFGAPIPDSTQQIIVDYIAKVKGIPIDNE